MLLGKGFGAWNTMPTSRRSATGSVPFENTETPSSRMSPVRRVFGISSFNRFTERRKVLLPQPEGPIRAVTARRGMATVTSNSAWGAPYQKLYVRTSMMVVGRSDGRTYSFLYGATQALFDEIGRAQVWTPVTATSRMPSSA